MKRKVVKHGPSTYIISLPSEWVKKYGIEKGSELEVITEGDVILVRTGNPVDAKEVEIDISNLDRTSIMYAIRSFYRLGYDSLKLKFDNPITQYCRENKKIKVLSVIHEEVNRLIGYEVIQEKEKTSTIKDIQETSKKDFDQILRRIFLLIIDTYNDFLEGIVKNDITLLETIEEKHNTITKFVSFCLRILNKKGFSSPGKNSYYYHIIALLDRITDIIKYSSRDAILNIRKNKQKLSKDTFKILDLVGNDLRKFYELFYRFNNLEITSINSNRYLAEKMLRDFTSKTNALEIIIVTNITVILELILDMIEARIALERLDH